MPEYFVDDDARARRLAAIRALRGTPDRLSQIQAQEQAKARAKRVASASASGRRTPENSDDIFGHPWPVWFRMRDAGLDHIEQTAREHKLTSYTALWTAINSAIGEDIGNHWRQLPNLLGYISEFAYEEFGIIPTALVVDRDGDQHPGPGFFRLAAQMGLLPESDAPAAGEEWLNMTDAQQVFWNSACRTVFDHFGGH